MFKIVFYITIFFVVVANFQCSTNKYEIVKFRCDEFGHTIIPILIGDISFEGIFDTGSSCSFINENDLSLTHLNLCSDSVFVFNKTNKAQVKCSRTNLSHIRVGNMKSSSRIRMSINESGGQPRIWGNDVIDQYYWQFDYNKMEAIISKQPIRMDTTDCVVIHYKKYDGANINICSLYLGDEDAKVDSLLIDTGGGIVMHSEKMYPIIVNLYYSKRIIDPLNSKYQRLSSDRSLSTDLPFKTDIVTSGEGVTAFYTGMIRVLNEKRIPLNINGILVLGNIKKFSLAYFDTKNQIIYLKK